MTKIQVRDLSVHYGSQCAVEGLSFDVAAGEVVALLGPNGAGKSSTVRCLLGLQDPSSGSCLLNGVEVARDPERAKGRVSYVPEHGSLYELLTPMETLLLRGRLSGMGEAAIREKSEALLRIFGLDARAHAPISGFSKGMRQKVVLLAALITGPEILVLDEPLAGLDALSTLVIKELLPLFCAEGRAVLYCSHLLDVVEKVAGRVLVLNEGRLVASGALAELVGQGSLDSAFRELTDSEDPAAKARTLLEICG